MWEQTGTLCVSDCTLRKLSDTVMTRNAEISTYVLLGVLFLIHITVLQKLTPKCWVSWTSRTPQDLQRLCKTSADFPGLVSVLQSFTPSFSTQSFPMAAASLCNSQVCITYFTKPLQHRPYKTRKFTFLHVAPVHLCLGRLLNQLLQDLIALTHFGFYVQLLTTIKTQSYQNYLGG